MKNSKMPWILRGDLLLLFFNLRYHVRRFYQLRTCCGPRSIEVQSRKEGFPAMLVRACSLRQTRHVCKYNATLFLWKSVFSQCFYLKKSENARHVVGI